MKRHRIVFSSAALAAFFVLGIGTAALATHTAQTEEHVLSYTIGDVTGAVTITDTDQLPHETITEITTVTETVTGTTTTTTTETEPPPTTTTPPPPTGCTMTLSPSSNVSNALASVSAGGTVCLGSGTYSQAIVYDRAATSFITLRCLSGVVLTNPSGHTLRVNSAGAFLRTDACRFVGSGVTSGGIIDSYGSFIQIIGGEVTGSNDNGIYTSENSDHNVFSGINIHDNGAPDNNQDHGIYLQGDDHVVSGNTISNHPLGFGIQMYDNGNNNKAFDNTISNSGHAGIVVGGGSGGTYTNVEIARNTVRGSASSTDIRNDRLDGSCTGDIHDNRTQKAITGFPSGCAVNNTIVP